MIVFSGDVSSTWQHSIRGTPLKKKKTRTYAMLQDDPGRNAPRHLI